MGPDPDAVYPNEKIKSVVFIKNVISRPNIIAGEYSYYDDNTGAEKFEEHVTRICDERREPQDEQRDDISVQHHGRRLGKIYAVPGGFAAERRYGCRE